MAVIEKTDRAAEITALIDTCCEQVNNMQNQLSKLLTMKPDESFKVKYVETALGNILNKAGVVAHDVHETKATPSSTVAFYRSSLEIKEAVKPEDLASGPKNRG